MTPEQKLKISIPLNDKTHIRIMQSDDITQSYIDGLNNTDFTQFMNLREGHVESHESVQNYVENNLKSDHQYLFGIFADNTLIGTSRLHIVGPLEHTYGLGIFIFQGSSHCQGIGSSTVHNISTYAFSDLGAQKIIAGIYGHNEASRKCFSKAEFEIESTDPNYNGMVREVWVKHKS